MPRFVILEHTGTPNYKPGVHWDLLLEDGEVLKAWELLRPLDSVPEQEVRTLADHRMLYLDYEGALSNDRGTVRKWDSGEYQHLSSSDGGSTYQLNGSRTRGEVQISSNPSDALSDSQTVLLRFVPAK